MQIDTLLPLLREMGIVTYGIFGSDDVIVPKHALQLFPDDFETRQFDDVYTAPHTGFGNVANYYERASSLQFIKRITIPTLIIHAQDDPFIPFASFRHQDIETNPNVALLTPEQGGHVGFISGDREGEERFWAEVMAIEFVKLLSS